MKDFSNLQVAEITTTYRNNIAIEDRVKITSSKEAYEVLKHNWDMDQIEHREEFKVILLNAAGHVLGIKTISQGGIAGTNVDKRLIFQTALLANASRLILSHNHPSGNLEPSDPDRGLTKDIVKAGKILNLNVYDHIIITPTGYYSFSDEGDM